MLGLKRYLRKMEKNAAKVDKYIARTKALQEVLDSPYFKERNEVFSIEEFYKLPKSECIMTTAYTKLADKKFEIPVLKEGIELEVLLYRYKIYMEEYFRPAVELEKTSTSEEIKYIRSPKRFIKWYKANKDKILKPVSENDLSK